MKKFFYILVFVLLAVVIFRGFLFRKFVKYESVGTRGIFLVIDEEDTFKSKNINEIIDYSLNKTARKLEFTFDNQTKPLITGKANCIGYCDYFSSRMNQILENNDMKDWKISHEIGKLEVFGIDIHQYFSSPFFKDHDFVTVENIKTGEKISIDPTVYDYFKIDRISLKN
ncbi:MAG: hypothetical protein QM564_04595 [Bergeyella sp.]